MIYVLYGIYVIVCIFLILVILLQSGKGGDVAAAFGGSGSQTAFGPRGAQKPLEKATIFSAGAFMLLALIFSLPGITGPRSVVKELPAAPSPSPSAQASVAPVTSPTASASVAPAAASPAASASVAPAATASPEKK